MVRPVAACELARATDQAVEDGARDLTLFMARSQLQPENVDRLTAQLTHVVASAAACGGLARVVLMTSGMTGEELRDGCRLAVGCGVDMVQGGAATTGDRASLSQLTQMRRELGAGVLLKWMAPVRSLDWFLVARAEGVDRFWGGVDYVLEQARDRQSWGEQIRVPRPRRGLLTAGRVARRSIRPIGEPCRRSGQAGSRRSTSSQSARSVSSPVTSSVIALVNGTSWWIASTRRTPCLVVGGGVDLSDQAVPVQDRHRPVAPPPLRRRLVHLELVVELEDLGHALAVEDEPVER